jgi:hypothetical protein
MLVNIYERDGTTWDNIAPLEFVDTLKEKENV